jgi:hypothetical protein
MTRADLVRVPPSVHQRGASLRSWFGDRKVATKILAAVGSSRLVLLGLTVQNVRQMGCHGGRHAGAVRDQHRADQ